MIDLTKLTRAPWEVSETKKAVRITAPAVDPGNCCKTVCDQNVNSRKSAAYPAALADLGFAALARNAFDGDPEALAWWEANRRKRPE